MFAEEGQDAAAAMTGGDKASAAAGLADSYDDPDGYYNLQVSYVCNNCEHNWTRVSGADSASAAAGLAVTNGNGPRDRV